MYRKGTALAHATLLTNKQLSREAVEPVIGRCNTMLFERGLELKRYETQVAGRPLS